MKGIPVHPKDIYGLTPSGEAELRGSRTKLSPLAIELLLRADGHTTVEQLRSSMPDVAADRLSAISAYM